VLNADMQRIVEEQRLAYVATVCPEGSPNLSPKGTTAVWDVEHLVFAHIHSHRTVANIQAGNDRVEVNVVDPIKRKGYRFKGIAAVHCLGPLCDAGLRFSRERSNLDPNRVNAIVLIRVTEVSPIISPAYDDGTSEDDVEARSPAMYGLRRH
jgi:uncharacterized protein